MILVLTGDDGRLNFGDLTARSHHDYAELHGYGFQRVRFLPETAGKGHPSWQKLASLRATLERADWVLWLDADTIITNYTLRIEDRILRDRDTGDFMIVSQDWNDASPWSGGVMLVSNSHMACDFLDVAAKQTKWMNAGCWDQSAMHDVWNEYRAYRYGIRIMPRRILQSVPRECSGGVVEPWQHGDFLAHATGIFNSDKRAILEKYHAKAIR